MDHGIPVPGPGVSVKVPRNSRAIPMQIPVFPKDLKPTPGVMRCSHWKKSSAPAAPQTLGQSRLPPSPIHRDNGS